MATADYQQATLLRSTGVVMDYGPTRALDHVDLVIERGQIHGLLGANGAGKSTFIKIIAGLQQPTGGRIELDGIPYEAATPAQAMRAGVRVAHQELAVVPALTVRQNLILGNRFRNSPSDAEYQALFDEWGVGVRLNQLMGDLPPATQATISLARSLVGDAKLVLLDEPTASLGPHEVEGLFRIIRRKAADGVGVVFVSHRLGEVSEICTDVTVLRNGRVVHSAASDGRNEAELAELIAPTAPTGHTQPITVEVLEQLRDHGPVGSPRKGGDLALSVKNLRLQRTVSDVSFDLHPGEVLGIAGLVGSGRTETLEALMGMRKIVSGSVKLDGEDFSPRSSYEAVSKGLALVPEERARQALFMQRDIVFNCSSSRFTSLGKGRGGWRTNPRAYRSSTEQLMSELRLKAGSLDDLIGTLSGGNQQKVVLGRVLTEDLRILLLDEPTRGVDVGARRDFQRVISQIAETGVAVVYVSSELAELSFCDRIQVIVEGRTTMEAPCGEAFDEEQLTRLCFARVKNEGEAA